MSKYLSDKLTVLYTLLIIMVVHIHSTYLEMEGKPVATFLVAVTRDGIAGVANTLFFAISGFLFARNVLDTRDVFGKMKKRGRSLVVPYLLWNLIFVGTFIVLENLPGVRGFINGSGTLERFASQPVWDSVKELFGGPAAFQLWFLRDLIVMILLTPVLWWIAKKSWQVAAVAALLSSIIYPWLIAYWGGIIVGTRRWDVEHYPLKWWGVALCAALFAGVGIITSLYESDILFKSHPLWRIFRGLVGIAGIYAAWGIYDLLVKGKTLSDKGIWKYICGYSFFIYCFHEPSLNIFKKLALKLFGTSEATLIIFYYLNPLLMVAFAILVAKCLQRLLPGVYGLLTGGRSRRPGPRN